MTPVVRRGTAADRDGSVETVVAAFAADPLLTWVFPGDRYHAGATAAFGCLYDLRVAGGEIRVVDDLSAVSLWTPPGGYRQAPAEREARWRVFEEEARPEESERFARFVAALDEGGDEHPDCWHLGVLGTHPARQGQGLGTSVIAPLLEVADADGLPAHLETATESNLGYYARLGFEVLRVVDVPDGPRIWEMWREPRGFSGRPGETTSKHGR